MPKHSTAEQFEREFLTARGLCMVIDYCKETLEVFKNDPDSPSSRIAQRDMARAYSILEELELSNVYDLLHKGE